MPTTGADTGFMKGGGHHILMKRCRRQCIEVRSADQSARSAEKFFRLHFSLLRMGSRGTFALCTASSRCTRIAGPRAAMSAQISPTNVIRTYTEGYTRSWSRSHAYYIGNDMDSIVRMDNPSRSVSGNARYCELRRPSHAPGVAT